MGMKPRFLLKLLPILLVALTAAAQLAPSHCLVYVGTYTDGSSKGIYAYDFDLVSGKASPLGLAAESANPSFLAASPTDKFLYAVNEVNTFKDSSGATKHTGAVSAYEIDRKTGKLKLLNQLSSEGAGPAYISIDKSGKYALVANYDGGSVAVFPIAADGKLEAASSFVQHKGSSVNKERQEAPHAHAIEVTADNRFALAADLGLDKLLVYRFDAAHGKLTPNAAPFGRVAPGAGPRHLAFHPAGKYVFVTNEMASTVTSFAWDATDGMLREVQTVSTLPKGYKGENDTAEIMVHPNGRVLYVSNRGRNSIATFSINPELGTLMLVDDTPTGGKIPRNFNLDPTAKWLFAANQDSGDIFIFRIDAKTGRLTPTGETLKVDKPVAILFVRSR